MPRFNEKDPDTFFKKKTLFKHITDSKRWLDVDRTLMLRNLLSERALEAYSTVSATDCLDYSKVKSAFF